MKKYLKSNMLYIAGAIIGSLGGYLYYINVGCSSGSCPITSSLSMSLVFGAIIGGLIFSLFKKDKNKDK